MNFTLISKEKNEAKFTMAFAAEDFDKSLNAAYQANKSKFAVDGFRKGKAPRSIIEAKYGADVFFEEAIDHLFKDAYPAALTELALTPVDQPSVAFGEEPLEKGKGFAVTITVTCAPEVEVKDYKGIKVDKIEHPVTEEDVQKELEAVQKRNARLAVVEREAKDGDTVILDYAGFVGEEQFAGGTAENQSLKLGSGTFIPGFEEQLIGAKAGSDVDVKVTFPEEYHAAELAGKEAVFKCKVHEVKEEQLPELNDDLAVDVSDFDTLEEYKNDIRTKLEASAADAAKYETENAVLTKLCEATELDIPEVMFEDEAESMLREFEMQLQQQGLGLDMYAKYLGKEIKDIKAELRPEAEKRVKNRLVIDAVSKAEDIKATEEDVEKQIQQMAEMYKMEVEELKKMMNLEVYSAIMQDVRTKKTIEFLVENAEIK